MATIIGDNGNNVLNGTGDADLIKGLKGNDIIDGAAGYDSIWAGDGNDTIISGDADFIDGGCGIDLGVLDRSGSTKFFTIDISTSAKVNSQQKLADDTALTGVERIEWYAGSGGSTVKGGCYADIMAGGAGIDRFFGGGGNDYLVGGTGDKLSGDGGDDLIQIDALPAKIDGGWGYDIVLITDAVTFTPGVITCVEKFQILDGATTFDLGNGSGEIVSFNNFFDPVGGPLTTGPGVTICVVGPTALGVNIAGSSHDDCITGGDGDDFINAGRGNDIVHGGNGSDRLNGNTGFDKLYGDGGDDFLYSKNPDGVDVRLDGGTGLDFGWIERTHETCDYRINVSNPGVTATDSLGMRVVNIERFYIEGGSGNDTVTTGAGSDLLVGNGGADILSAGGGSDQLMGDAGKDRLNGGADTDYALYTGSQSEYLISNNNDGTYTITDLRGGSPEGADLLRNIEYVTFNHTSTFHGIDFLLV